MALKSLMAQVHRTWERYPPDVDRYEGATDHQLVSTVTAQAGAPGQGNATAPSTHFPIRDPFDEDRF